MQTRPKNWETLFAGPHKTEYKFLIAGEEYRGSDLQGTPMLLKPLMDRPSVGRCGSGTLTLSVRKKEGVPIPTAASVTAFCRLASKDGSVVTDWVEQGHFCVSKRQGKNIINLTCRDLMLKAGELYAPRATFSEWPVPMSDVVAEIAAIMGVTVDPRTVIKSGRDFVVPRPSDDTLMSEVLAGIGAAHFGSWVMTERGQLRLIPMTTWGAAPICQEIGGAFGKYTPISTEQKISRLTLIDSADNEFTVGDDSGREIAANCEYATQGMVDAMLEGAAVQARTLVGLDGSVSKRSFRADGLNLHGRSMMIHQELLDIRFVPYILTGAYLDPCLEVGDTVAIDSRGTRVELMLASMTIRCNQSFNADVSFEVEDDDEDEYPYTDLQTLRASRLVSTHKSYYGAKISRDSGFVSERIVDGVVMARMTANADLFAMQQRVDSEWQDRIYFDAVKGKYVITGEVEVVGALTVTDLENEQEKTFINGANIITGTLSANAITSGKLQSTDGSVVFDLDNNVLTVGGDDVLDAIAKVDNQVTILADSQLFTRADGEEDYQPAQITLKAQTRGNLSSFQWYKDGSLLVGATADTLVLIPTDFAGNSATYSVICKDRFENTYTDFISIAKLTGGEQGSDGYNTATVYLYKRSASPVTVDWTGSLKYIFADPPHLESVPTGWFAQIPAGSDPLYVTTAVAYSNISYDFIPVKEWSPPIILAANGANGEQGYSTAIVNLYKRSKSAVTVDWTKPLTYSFSGKGLTSVPTGWYKNVPDGNDPLYITSAVAFGNKDTVDLGVDAWAAPALLVENGVDGLDGKDGSPGKDGAPGADGRNTAPVFLYQRAESTPEKPTSRLTYTFASGKLTGDLGAWSQEVTESDGNPCYVTQATASGQYSTDTILPEEWSAPVKLVVNGTDGADGADGERGTGILAVTTAPESYTVTTEGVKPNYRIALTTVVTQSGVGDPRVGDVIRYSYYDYPVILIYSGYVYTGKRVSVRGATGAAGAAGANTAIVHLYKRAETRPSVNWNYDLTYTFATGKLSGFPDDWDWSQEVVDGYDPLYVISATAYGTGETDTIGPNEWSTAMKLAEDGTDGYNTATVFLYQRAAEQPSAPTGDLTYTFASGTLTGTLGKWKTVLPDIDGNPCYVIQATAASRLEDDVIRASEWTPAVKLVEDGYNTATVFLYQRKNTTPAVPSGNLTYTFSTGNIAGTLSGWQKTIPGNDGNPCYVIQATAISPTDTYVITKDKWGSAALLVENGAPGKDGEPGKDGSPGKDGAPGADGVDGYTVLLSRQYIMVNVDVNRKPTTAETVTSVVSVYEGLTALTATKNTPAEGQFKVAAKNTITGITVAQNTAGTLSLTISKATAISDTSVLQLEVTLHGGMTLQANIVIQANMNSVVAAHESSIKTLEDEIVLKVSETQYHTQMPTYSSTDPSTGWSAGDKAANVGFLWYDTSAKALKSWSGSKWDSASDDTWASHAEASVSVTATKIGWLVKSGTSASNFTMTDRAIEQVASTLTLTATPADESDFKGDARVDPVSGATYGFTKTADNYYTCQNGISSSDASVAVCKVVVTTTTPTVVTLECINNGYFIEQYQTLYNYGYIGQLDTELSTTTEDPAAKILKKFTQVSDLPQLAKVFVPAGTHYFCVKYYRGARFTTGDYFKFKQVSGDGTSSILTLQSGSTILSASAIMLKGLVTFESLETSGQTVINGDNIRTGTIHGVDVITEKKTETTSTGEVYALAKLDSGGVMWSSELRNASTGAVIPDAFYTRNIGQVVVASDYFPSKAGVAWNDLCVSLESYSGSQVRVYSPGTVMIRADSVVNIRATEAMFIQPNGWDYGTAGQCLKSGGSGSSVYWDSAVSCDLLVVANDNRGTISHNAYANGYKAIVIIGHVSSSGTKISTVIPTAITGRFQISDESYYMSFDCYNNYFTFAASNNGYSAFDYVYGIK